MRAMILEKPGTQLQLLEKPDPIPGPGEVQVKISACGVCRTDLHVVDGDLTEPLNCQSFRGMKLSVPSVHSARVLITSSWVSGSVFPGWGVPVDVAFTASPAQKTSAMNLDSPATRSTEALLM